MPLTAGIDVGSNTVRMLIARVEDGRIVEILSQMREITRLGANIAETGKLSEASMRKTIELFKIFRNELDKFAVDRIFAAATSAVREASNSVDFLAAAHAVGIPLTTITGDEEACYTYLGVSHLSHMSEAPERCVLYDIGGGSTEFIYAENGKLRYNKSIPIGVVKLSDRYNFDKVSDYAAHRLCKDELRQVLAPVADSVKILAGGRGVTLIGNAGTVTTIAAVELALEKYDPFMVNKHILAALDMKRLLDRIAPMARDERLKLPGLEPGREDLIVPGILFVQVIMEIFGSDTSCVSDYGLREGLAIAAAER